jgi:hypothetical protein
MYPFTLCQCTITWKQEACYAEEWPNGNKEKAPDQDDQALFLVLTLYSPTQLYLASDHGQKHMAGTS